MDFKLNALDCEVCQTKDIFRLMIFINGMTVLFRCLLAVIARAICIQSLKLLKGNYKTAIPITLVLFQAPKFLVILT